MQLRNRPNNTQDIVVKLEDIPQTALRLNVGTQTARKLAEEAGAIVRIGKLVRVNIPVLYEFIDTISE